MKYDKKNDDWDEKSKEWICFNSSAYLILEDIGGERFNYSFKQIGLKKDLDFCSYKCYDKWAKKLLKKIKGENGKDE